MYDLLNNIADELSKKFNIDKEKVLKTLQHSFYPYEQNNEDTFLQSKIDFSGFKL